MRRNRAGSQGSRIDEQVTFELAGTQRHFGMPSDRATISMYVSDEEQLSYVSETLAQCFSELWGVEPELTVGAFKPNARSFHRGDGEVTFHVWNNGDPSVGIGGDQARVTMWIPDEEYLGYAREMLEAAFAEFWDAPAFVMTEQEAREPDYGEEPGDVYEPNLTAWQRAMRGPTPKNARFIVTSVEQSRPGAYRIEIDGGRMTAMAYEQRDGSLDISPLTGWASGALASGTEEKKIATAVRRMKPNAARRRKLHAGVKPWRVALSSAANPDIEGGYWQGSMPGRPRSVPVASFEEASQVVQNYIAENELGGGNWTGGEITDYATGKVLGRVSYNGRVWPPGEWHSGQKALWPNRRNQ